MNYVQWTEIAEQLFGTDANFRSRNLKHLLLIQRWLGISGTPCFEIENRARFAPSLSTRAEAQLFGVSLPRFCIRLYADEKHTGFFNLRRSALLAQKIKDHGGWAKRRADKERRISEAKEYSNGEEAVVEKPGLIGDSIFGVPERFASKYNVLTAHLHPAYGEVGQTDSDSHVLTTPFIQHFWTTGLCGHAAIFMCSMLMQKFMVSSHALAEIAALLRSHKTDEILITGLSPRHISNYFSNKEVGLQAFYQLSPFRVALGDKEELSVDRNEIFRNALRAYLLSGMPVIKHVDWGRLHGFGGDFDANDTRVIYKRNKTGFNLKVSSGKLEHHCVVILGCSKQSSDGFLLCDPGAFPYLEASAVELMNASNYDGTSTPSDPNPKLTGRRFQPVTPGPVLMPLHKQVLKHGDREESILGLYQIALHVFEDPIPYPDVVNNRPSRQEYLPGEFRLVQTENISRVLDEKSWLGVDGAEMSNALKQSVKDIQDELANKNPRHWYWVQRFSKACWIWDAQLAPPFANRYQFQDIIKHLVAIASEETKIFVEQEDSDQAACASGEDDSPPPRCDDPIEISLITSYHAHSTRKAIEEWPDNVRTAELYAFMQDDVKELLLHDAHPGLSAVQAMSTLADNTLEIARVAEELDKIVTERQIKIRGFATFIPELLDASEGTRHVAKRAFVFLCQLAKALKEHGHPASLIEMVGGSMVAGVLPVEYREKRRLLANRKTTADLESRLLTEIGHLCSVTEDYDVRFAIEAEPGPLFAFSTEAGIDSLVAQIEDMEQRGDLPLGRVGLNLDIGHWMLSHVKPAKLREPDLAKRIYGAHISDHPKCHTGDAIAGSINGNGPKLKQWIRELESLPRESFCSVVSVEFECAKNKKLLQVAVDAVMVIRNNIERNYYNA